MVKIISSMINAMFFVTILNVLVCCMNAEKTSRDRNFC